MNVTAIRPISSRITTLIPEGNGATSFILCKISMNTISATISAAPTEVKISPRPPVSRGVARQNMLPIRFNNPPTSQRMPTHPSASHAASARTLRTIIDVMTSRPTVINTVPIEIHPKPVATFANDLWSGPSAGGEGVASASGEA